jgi:uncharacterized repeat protein (TIGR03803 family)
MRFGLRIGLCAAALGVCLAVVAPGAGPNAAAASTLTTIYSFCPPGGDGSCSDGYQPWGSLVRDSRGNLFGVTPVGGADGCNANCGVIYEVKKNKTFKVVYAFCKTGGGCKDGANPHGGLIIDVNGNLYGTVNSYGKYDNGGIFRISSSGKKYSVLYSFCSKANCADGTGSASTGSVLTYPGAASGAPYDGVSPLYGVATGGGANDSGVIFELQPAGRKWTYTVLYSFCSQSNCADGATPRGLMSDASGNLYGTTNAGGGNNIDFNHYGGGTVFKMSGFSYQKLYSFCAQANCNDGEYPAGSTVMDGQGNLVGTTTWGGSKRGTLFKIDPSGAYTKLYDFCSQPSCADGDLPYADPFIDANGNLFGAASDGGSANGGVIYKFDGTLHVLYNFCTVGTCADGAGPIDQLIADRAGNFYGATIVGGATDQGTVFEFTP